MYTLDAVDEELQFMMQNLNAAEMNFGSGHWARYAIVSCELWLINALWIHTHCSNNLWLPSYKGMQTKFEVNQI